MHVVKDGDVIETIRLAGPGSPPGTVFGRCPSCEGGHAIRLDHPSISRNHAVIVRGSGDQFFLMDLGSSHGTFLSGQKIVPHQPVLLTDRAVIVFGLSSRCYVVRLDLPRPSPGQLDEAAFNAAKNRAVFDKPRSLSLPDISLSVGPPRLMRRVSFSNMAPEIIPYVVSNPLTPADEAPGASSSTWRRLPPSPCEIVKRCKMAP